MRKLLIPAILLTLVACTKEEPGLYKKSRPVTDFNPRLHQLLDDMRLLCRGKTEPIKEVYQRFNDETDDGRNMAEMSELLSEAINSIIDVKEESDIDSLFKSGGTSALMSAVTGLDDFELVCFLVVTEG